MDEYMKVYTVVASMQWDGYKAPLAVYDTLEKAEAFAKTVNKELYSCVHIYEYILNKENSGCFV